MPNLPAMRQQSQLWQAGPPATALNIQRMTDGFDSAHPQFFDEVICLEDFRI